MLRAVMWLGSHELAANGAEILALVVGVFGRARRLVGHCERYGVTVGWDFVRL